MIGIALGWVPPILNQLRNSHMELSLTDEECSWIPSLYYITRATGPFLTALLVDRLGRNMLLVFAAFINCLIWVIILFTRSVIWLYITRMIFGTVAGMHESTLGIYIGENCSPEMRGTLTMIVTLFFYFGEVAAFILATYLSYDHVAVVHSGFGFLGILSTFLLKEPAQFLIMKGKVEKAENNFYWLRCSTEKDLKTEFDEIKTNVLEEKSKTTFIEDYQVPAARKSLRIVVTIMFLMMLTGFSAINSFITMTFPESEYLTQNEFTILFGTFQLICCCISSCIVEKFNRRTLFLFTCAIMTLSQAGTVFLYYCRSTWNIPYFSWLLFASLTIYSCIFGMLMYPLTSAIRGELLPQSIKAVGSSISVAAASIGGFLSTKTFLPISIAYGMETNFIFYAAVCLILFVYIYIDLPETRSKSLIEIQKELRTKT